jgi:hypothetical protein
LSVCTRSRPSIVGSGIDCNFMRGRCCIRRKCMYVQDMHVNTRYLPCDVWTCARCRRFDGRALPLHLLCRNKLSFSLLRSSVRLELQYASALAWCFAQGLQAFKPTVLVVYVTCNTQSWTSTYASVPNYKASRIGMEYYR